MNEEQVRDQVSRAYDDALKRSKEKQGGCCGPTQAASTEARPGFAEAKASSFGCGNPVGLAGLQPGQTIVDLGSGAGLDLLLAAERVGPTGRVIGVDMTDSMIAAARAAAARAGYANVEVRKGIIEELPVQSASADWVVSNCVINLSPDKPRVFAEIARVLRPGGRFSVADIVAEGLPDWILKSAEAYAACVGGAISEADYTAGLRAAGLADVEIADRLVYGADELRALVASDLERLALDPKLVDAAIAAAAGRVASVRVIGRRP